MQLITQFGPSRKLPGSLTNDFEPVAASQARSLEDPCRRLCPTALRLEHDVHFASISVLEVPLSGVN